MSTIYCSKCGNQLNADAKFCSKCGSPVEPVDNTEANSATITCYECGQTIPADVESCPNCGAPMSNRIICYECGQSIPNNAKSCPHCGAPMVQKRAAKETSQATQPTPQPQEESRQPIPEQPITPSPEAITPAYPSDPEPKKKSKSLPWILLAIVAIVAVIAILLLLKGKQDVGTQTGYDPNGGKNIESAENVQTGQYAGFTVSPGRQVVFSKGNLQYRPSTGESRFAEEQYETIGDGNQNISDDYDGWLDLFSWGTGNDPAELVTYNEDRNYYEWLMHDEGWRSPTKSEWEYLFNGRDNAKEKYAFATVEGNVGIIILPDEWNKPQGVSLKTSGSTYSSNIFTASQWRTLESAGAVFLPAAGRRDGVELFNIGNDGDYWSSSRHSEGRAYNVDFSNGNLTPNDNSKMKQAFAVRLVKDL